MKEGKKVLLTGGAGYLGSHTAVELLERNYEVVIVDNLSNSKRSVLDQIELITNKKVIFYPVDILNTKLLRNVFSEHRFSAVIHFAASKVLAESITNPLKYYRNNVGGILNLLEVMGKYAVHNFVFSSTAAVYSDDEELPLTEESKCRATTPYGRTKLISEEIIKDVNCSEQRLDAVILRYFNPIGAHPSGLIGESPTNYPDNLLPYVSMTAKGEIPYLQVYGNDYNTIDGTGVRDFIHVVDLAKGHLHALEKLYSSKGVFTYNLGCGKGYSVLEVIKTFEEVIGKKINYKITARRPGDLGAVFADPSKAEKELNWKAKFTLKDMCHDVWKWQNSKYKF